MHLKTAALIDTLAASLVFPGHAKAQEDRQIWKPGPPIPTGFPVMRVRWSLSPG